MSDPFIPLWGRCLDVAVKRVRSLVGVLILGTLIGTASSRSLMAQASVSHRAPLLAFEQHGGRLVAIFDQALLATDFLLTAQVTTAPTGVAADRALVRRLASGALRLRRAAGSLVLAEYVGVRHGRPTYRPRAAMPILHEQAGHVAIDAAPLLRTLAPRPEATPASFISPGSFAPWSGSAEALSVSMPSRTWEPGAAFVMRTPDAGAVTYAVDVLRLPTVPMRGRLFDGRVPFLRADGTSYIRRIRLEKQDPTKPVSDVARPVVVRLSAAFASRRLYAEAALREWNAAFEALGYRGVLRLQSAADPLPADSVVMFTVEPLPEDADFNAGEAFTTTDPRSGEILKAQIFVETEFTNWKIQYFTFLAMHDRRARWPLPDELVGDFFRQLLAHEVGHALGLDHNFKVDAYPTDSLRQPSFVARMGHVPSIMNYSGVNFVAQPEDHFAPEHLVNYVGVYDRWALSWGYRPIPEAATTEAELPVLTRWIAAQDTALYLRPAFGEEYQHMNNPYAQPELLGDDILKALSYGIRNVAGVAQGLKADLTPDLRSMLRRRWQILMDYLTPVLGGIVPAPGPLTPSSASMPMRMIDTAYQARAIRFLMARAFYGQDELIRQMLPHAPPNDSTLVLFDSLAPEWDASEAILQVTGNFHRPPMRQWQESFLSALSSHVIALRDIYLDDRDNPEEAVKDVIPAIPGALAVTCRELSVFNRRLAAYPRSGLSAAMRQHVDSLASILAPVFDRSSPGPCAQ